ncbi:hypothetical protein [Halpernia sp.]|uniref:hypothetical protein n=1 Tax=Halpernia sp. TaxID=2782209 RepID=UPI003A9441D1
MENLSPTVYIVILLLIITYYSVSIFIFDRKRKGLINDYEKLLNLKDWYEKISDEASRSYIVESVEKRGQELINQFKVLNADLVEIQEQHKNLQEQQKKLHHSLLEEHKLLNEYFENYS